MFATFQSLKYCYSHINNMCVIIMYKIVPSVLDVHVHALQ